MTVDGLILTRSLAATHSTKELHVTENQPRKSSMVVTWETRTEIAILASARVPEAIYC